jgi:deazaflavin-dependent oxidoreductase (nitroreductase family)
MAKEYHASKFLNGVMKWTSRLGIGRSETLTTIGRRSGKSREVPVSPIEVDGREYLVAPYGDVSWVENARANPSVTLRHGSTSRRRVLIEVTEEAAHVVKAYWDREKFPRPYMDVPGGAEAADFAEVAERFPVFRVEEQA